MVEPFMAARKPVFGQRTFFKRADIGLNIPEDISPRLSSAVTTQQQIRRLYLHAVRPEIAIIVLQYGHSNGASS